MTGARLEVVDASTDGLAATFAHWVAAELDSAIVRRGRATLAVSGGSTPAVMFDVLATLTVDWDGVHVFQVDERVSARGGGRNLDDLHDHLIAPAGVPSGNVHAMDVEAVDVTAAATTYGARLREVTGDGVLDVVHLGLGDDGHTASWPPGDPVVEVSDRDVAIVGPYRGKVRMTLTVPAVNRARRVGFLVAGADKADAVAGLLAGDPALPATRVRAEGTVLFGDRSALGKER